MEELHFKLTLEELDKIIELTRGILEDVDNSPVKAKYKIERLADFFDKHREALIFMKEKLAKKKKKK